MDSFFNPFSDLPEIPLDPGLPPEEHVRAGCISILLTILIIILALCLCALFGSCRSAAPELTGTHTVHHWHTDTLRQTDSTVIERETTIRELDSAQMAAYGIALKDAQRAWLIQTRELERQLQRLREATATRDTIRDSIPYAVPTPVEVTRKLTWWQQTRLHIANIALFAISILLFVRFGVPLLRRLIINR